MDGIAKAKKRGVRFGRKSLLLPETVKEIRTLREAGTTVPEIIRRTGLSKASIYRALAVSAFDRLSVHVRYAPVSRPDYHLIVGLLGARSSERPDPDALSATLAGNHVILGFVC